MKNRKFSYQKWLDSAQDELNFAKVNLQEQPKFPWYICFHAQQAATRYPDALPGMTFSGVFKKNEAKEAVELSEEIVKFVKEKIHIK